VGTLSTGVFLPDIRVKKKGRPVRLGRFPAPLNLVNAWIAGYSLRYVSRFTSPVLSMSKAIVVMGVSGCGKTTIGRSLARRLGCPFHDGDDFHPPENVTKMAQGIPLTDADRAPWLARLHDLLEAYLGRGEGVVLACSALKKKYREQLRVGNEGVLFVYLQGDFETIWRRMQSRPRHYMKANMLQSQFEALEPPGPAEAITISVTLAPAEVVKRIVTAIAL